MIEYIITESKLNIDEVITDTYGISAVCDGKVVRTINDISVNKCFVLALTQKLNFFEVELCHFYEIVIDELNA